jgi:outer membrane receptor for ferrienterochelin and colicins
MPASSRFVRPLALASGLALLCTAGRAQDSPPPPAPPPAASAPRSDAPATTLRRVEIDATRASPTEERRQSTAAKIVIGREEIEQFGDTTLGDVLRRLPGVTLGGRPGRGGELRMRGMGSGYTQILIDGQRAPRGFSIDQLDPEVVERIELFRAPTAETGTRAIAGTINIVLREPLRTLSDDVRAGFGVERGQVSPGASWTRNDGFGEHGTYNLTARARRGRERTDTIVHSVYTDPGSASPVLDHIATDSSLGERDGVSLSSQVRWRLGTGEFFMLQPFWTHGQGSSTSAGTLAANGGSTPAPYAQRTDSGSSSSDVTRLTAQLNRRVAESTRIELRGSAGAFRSTSRSRLQQFGSDGSTVLTQHADTTLSDRSTSLAAKLLHLLGESHSFVGGWEVERVARVERATTLLNGAPQVGEFGDDIRASTQRHALYLQDEWEPAADWSANAGLRAEQIRTHGERESAPVQHTSRVVSPIAHLVWRFDAPRRDQLRLSLTQSYRPPALQSLVAVPRFSTLFPPPGANTASSPDVAGNPALRPERANGIDLAFEHYLGGGGIVSVNLFHRRIRDLIRNVRRLEDVPWATSPRWVSRPVNLGDATTHGLEFDARFRLTEYLADAPAVNVRANLGLYRSRVDAVPGPDNRIDQQPGAIANLGADHRFAGTAWTFGGSAALTPRYRTQLTDVQSQDVGRKRIFDAYLLWQIDPATRLRLSLSNIAPRDSVSTSTIVDGTQTQATTTTGRTDTSAALRLEVRL